MGMKIYDSLQRKKRDLQPMQAGQVGMYVCGPTVYDDCHIGHIMGPIIFDTLCRWFKACGQAVTFVNNITDIDDKIINRSKASGEDWQAITRRYTEQYFDLLRQLQVNTVTHHPRCSEHVPQMIGYIADLISKDRAYTASDGVYYDVARQPGYGKLTGRSLDDLQESSRVNPASGLRSAADFCLWKLAKPGEPSWESPWGAGRPGWHIECSVMSTEILGHTFDIHGGGDDLKFPHHENEIAQAEAHGGDYAHLWMHNGLIVYEGVKVGKSDPRMKDPEFAGQFKAQTLIDRWGSDTLRTLLLSGHYRKPFDFAPARFASTKTGLRRLKLQLYADRLFVRQDKFDLQRWLSLPDLHPASARIRACRDRLDDDFNTGAALAELYALGHEVRRMDAGEAGEALVAIDAFLQMLGLVTSADEPEERVARELDSRKIEALIAERNAARAGKDFARADALRIELDAMGVQLLDSKNGTEWSIKS